MEIIALNAILTNLRHHMPEDIEIAWRQLIGQAKEQRILIDRLRLLLTPKKVSLGPLIIAKKINTQRNALIGQHAFDLLPWLADIHISRLEGNKTAIDLDSASAAQIQLDFIIIHDPASHFGLTGKPVPIKVRTAQNDRI